MQRLRGGSPEEGTLEPSAESLHTWLRALEKRFGGRPVALSLETSRGAIILTRCSGIRG